MSMENAILAHAAALTALAEAIKGLSGGWAPVNMVSSGETIKGTMETTKGNTAAEAADKTETTAKSIKAEPKGEAGNDADKAATQSDESSQTAGAGSGNAETAMDYNKDVKPRLLAVVKKVGKEKLAALVEEFGAKRADAVDPAKFADLLAAAEALEK